MGQSWYNLALFPGLRMRLGTIMGQSWDNHETIMVQSWDNHETIMVQSWDNHGTIMRQSQQWKCKHDTQTICARVYIHYNLSIQNIQHLNVKSSSLIRHSVIFILQQWFTTLVHGLVRRPLISSKAYRLVWNGFIVCSINRL